MASPESAGGIPFLLVTPSRFRRRVDFLPSSATPSFRMPAPQTPAQRAAVLRKRMLRAAETGDAGGVDDAMTQLYDDAASPLLEDEEAKVGRPEAFAPLVEALAIAMANGHRQLANDLFANCEHLHHGFGVPFEVFERIERALDGSFRSPLSAIETRLEEALKPTCLAGKVKARRLEKRAPPRPEAALSATAEHP